MDKECPSLSKLSQNEAIRAVCDGIFANPSYSRVLTELQKALINSKLDSLFTSDGSSPADIFDTLAALQNGAVHDHLKHLQETLAEDRDIKRKLAALVTPEQIENLRRNWVDLEANADVAQCFTEVSQQGETALLRHWSNSQVLEKIARGTEVSQVVVAVDAAYQAAIQGSTEDMVKACAGGYDVVNHIGEHGTALHVACSYGDLPNVDILLAHRADPNIVSKDLTPLMSLVNGIRENLNSSGSYGDCAKSLLARGADPSLPDAQGSTAKEQALNLKDAVTDEIDDATTEEARSTLGAKLALANRLYKVLKTA